MLFIGHRLEEVFAIADRITVLRDGEVVGSRPAGEFTQTELVAAMVGRKAQAEWKRAAATRSSRHAARSSRPQSQRCLQGHLLSRGGRRDRRHGGPRGRWSKRDRTRHVRGRRTARRKRRGVRNAVAPGRPERRDQGGSGIRARGPQAGRARRPASRLPEHVDPAHLDGGARSAGSAAGRSGLIAAEWFRRLDVRARSVVQPVSQLSGGNQQKVVLAKWLATDPKVLILDEPTRGVDVGAKGEIHKLIDGLAQQGLGILVISSDLPEILALSDRILVISEGRLMGELPGGSSSEDVLAPGGRRAATCRAEWSSVTSTMTSTLRPRQDRLARSIRHSSARVEHLRAARRGHAGCVDSGAAVSLGRQHPEHLPRDRAARRACRRRDGRAAGSQLRPVDRLHARPLRDGRRPA